MLDPVTYEEVKNGIPIGLVVQPDPTPRYLHNGRGLGSETRQDVLYQEYLMAYLVLNTLGVPLKPAIPISTRKIRMVSARWANLISPHPSQKSRHGH